MNVAEFENDYWRQNPQQESFRHRAAWRLTEADNVLDIGCGDGFFLKKLQEKGIKGQGVDISSVSVEKCRQAGLEALVIESGADQLPFLDRQFGAVFLLDVLEHVYNPDNILAEAARVADQVIISVPNFNSLPARIQVLFGRVPENNSPRKGHVYWFNWKTLEKTVAGAGLKIVASEFNTFWETKAVIGPVVKKMVRRWPALFALSFVIKTEKVC